LRGIAWHAVSPAIKPLALSYLPLPYSDICSPWVNPSNCYADGVETAFGLFHRRRLSLHPRRDFFDSHLLFFFSFFILLEFVGFIILLFVQQSCNMDNRDDIYGQDRTTRVEVEQSSSSTPASNDLLTPK
jgi:hypothetical protein